MATLQTRHIAKPNHLKSIDQDRLIGLLNLDADFFSQRGYPLPDDPSELDYNKIGSILNDPSGMSTELQEAMFEVNELAKPDEELYDIILEKINGKSWAKNIGDEPSQADLAVLVFLNERSLIEEIHAQNYLRKPKSFLYYRTKSKDLKFTRPSDEDLESLRESLNIVFKEKKRGDETAKVIIIEEEDKKLVNFLVRRGDPVARQAVIDDNGESGSVFYRPEQYDLLVYNAQYGEFRITAKTQWLGTLYRQAFGEYCFGDSEFFAEVSRYSFEPLRELKDQALRADEFPTIEKVKLKEIHIYHPLGETGHTEIRKGTDLFRSFDEEDIEIPAGDIQKVSFAIKLKGVKSPQTLKIGDTNKESVGNDQNRALFEEWMRKRGFIVSDVNDEE